MLTEIQTPDAVRSLLQYAGAGDSFAKLMKLQREFSEVLNVSRVYVRHQGHEHFITGSPDDTLNVSTLQAQSGVPRYRWKDRGDGVLYGYINRDLATC